MIQLEEIWFKSVENVAIELFENQLFVSELSEGLNEIRIVVEDKALFVRKFLAEVITHYIDLVYPSE